MEAPKWVGSLPRAVCRCLSETSLKALQDGSIGNPREGFFLEKWHSHEHAVFWRNGGMSAGIELEVQHQGQNDEFHIQT